MDFGGYYLESDPCLVCNNPEMPYASLKLSTLKVRKSMVFLVISKDLSQITLAQVDTKYTTTTHIVKLSSSHSISKISLRIGDVKRQKMVRAVNIYYNNRSVQV